MKRIKQAGFTIVELLMVIIVSAVVIGSLSLVTTSLGNLSQRARNVAAADAFAENKIESLRSAGFLALPLGSSDLSSELPAELKSPRSASMEVSLSTVSTKRVFITLSYNDRGVQRTHSYTTLVGELGVGQY